MDPSWRQIDVFPIIARIVRERSIGGAFVSHDEIVHGLLRDSEGISAIDESLRTGSAAHSAEWLAHNMLAWFSQRITAGHSAWADEPERTLIDGMWAYRIALT